MGGKCEDMVLMTSSIPHTIPKGMANLRPPTRPCFESLAEWSLRSLKDGPTIPLPRVMSLSYLDAQVYSGLSFDDKSHRGDGVNQFGASHRICDVEALEKRRHDTENNWLSYHKQISKAYNKQVKPCSLFVGDLVLKETWYIQKSLKCLKVCP